MHVTDNALAEQVKAADWIHTIDLGNGLVTPGAWPPSPLIQRAFATLDFRDKKVLDIGCLDGLWSFEAEKRGAREVHATDLVTQRPYRDRPAIELARRILNSRIKYYPNLSVYQIEQLGIRDFDLVLFCGVYYHLKNPLLALSKLRGVLKTGGLLLAEGEVIGDERRSYARFFYRQQHRQDASNWWVPTIACLREWLECSFFRSRQESSNARLPVPGTKLSGLKHLGKKLLGRGRATRYLIVAEAVRRKDPHYIYPDDDLREWDLNDYS
jgi:tRNA (mo5U34)-methyltransferase